MNSIDQIPEWLATAVVAAIIAALGYVGKLLIELFQSYNNRRRSRRSQLIQLQSLLRATRVAFEIQNLQAQKLTNSIEINYPEISKNFTGYEEKISRAYNNLNNEEKELHSIIRSITINTLYPTNKATLKWLRNDTFFKAEKSNNKIFSELAKKLVDLESHLILWIAKYEAWFPNYPEHALNYMADEKEHGLGFPNGIDQLVEEAVNKF